MFYFISMFEQAVCFHRWEYTQDYNGEWCKICRKCDKVI